MYFLRTVIMYFLRTVATTFAIRTDAVIITTPPIVVIDVVALVHAGREEGRSAAGIISR